MKLGLTLRSLFITASSVALISCGGGGGGGGDDFVGAAQVSIRTTPTKFDTGDRTQSIIEITRVNESGVVLKLRTPLGLKYVPSTAFLGVDNSKVDVSPEVNVVQGNYNYIVFSLPRSIFSKGGEGRLTVQFEASSRINDGKIEVDPDVDDPAIPNSSEFDAANPEFLAEDQVRIEVKG